MSVRDQLKIELASNRLSAASTPCPVRLHWAVKIPLRDGVHLSATLYLPIQNQKPAPCLFSLTPYTVDPNHPRASYFAAHGFPFLVVDSRGRGNSEGMFRPYIQESDDGFDVVEWIAKQPFCDGQVAMFSGSYEGYDQWATARQRPPHLRTIVPGMAAALGIDFPMRNNIPYPYMIRWITGTSGHTSQAGIFYDQRFWRRQFYEWYKSGCAFRELDVLVGNPSKIFQEWVDHPLLDAYWDSYTPTADEYGGLDLPILTLTGIYDSDQPGALHFYREHLRHATDDAKAKHYLVIGPWDHQGTLAPKTEFGGLKFGSAAALDVLGLHVEWYDWILRGGRKPAFLQENVTYYVTGAEKWRYAKSLEAVTACSKRLYLDSSGIASDIHASGWLRESIGKGAPDSYVYDPRDLSIADVELELDFPPQIALLRPTFPADSLVDQSFVYANEGKALIYHSEPFSQDTELSGFFTLTAWLSVDQPDTDFLVIIYELMLDGRSILLTSDLMRARYRESLRNEKLVRTTDPLRYEFNRFTFISRELKKGSRLRLFIGPLNSIHYQKNYNSGKVVADESIKDARIVTVRLLHDQAHPSVLHVPIAAPDR